MDKKYDVICIGQAVQDILTTNVPKDAFMRETNTVKADSLTITTGGDAVNEAIVLSRDVYKRQGYGDHYDLVRNA